MAATSTKRKARSTTKRATTKRTPRRTAALLDPDARALLLNAISAGAFEHVAADAIRIHPGTLRRWKAKGEEALALEANGEPVPPELEPYRALCADLRQARASARTRAENRVFTENPLAWLRYGPGRHQGDQEGWTAALHAEVEHSGEIIHEVVVVYEGDDWAEIETGDEEDADGD